MDAFFEVENLTKRFGGLVAVDNVSFEVGRDEIVGLIGPNGAGKTTLVRCILGILKPDSGKVTFKGEDITRNRSWDVVRKGLVGTFQVVKPFRRLPIIANVMVGCLSPRVKKRGEWVKRIEIKARDALEFVGIADMALEPASVLSHGDLKRLEVARAIATDPELLILDEPFGGLNPAETELMAKSIKRLHKGGRLSELMKIVDRVVVLNFGGVITQGTPEEIARNEQVIEAYTGKEVLIA